MDLFCEYLVEKKSPSDSAKRAGIILGCIVLCLAISYIVLTRFPSAIAVATILIAAIIYASVQLQRNFSLEFEYVFVNGVLDIDVIKGRIRRKQLISIPCRKIEYMGAVRGISPTQNNVINAMYDESLGGKFVATFSYNGQKTDLYFQPPEKLLNYMHKYNPRNIHIS